MVLLEVSRGGHEDAQRSGAHLPWRQAESWGCSSWRREDSRKTLQHLPIPNEDRWDTQGQTTETDVLAEPVAIGQRGIALN